MSEQNPVHVAIVMDGNRRWAKKNNLPNFWGHRRGVRTVSEIAQAALENDIQYLTLFAFSTENWKRSRNEITYLMGLFSRAIERYTIFLLQREICIQFIGDLTSLQADLSKKIASIQEKTRCNTKLFLTIALNYGSRDEIARAIKKIPTEALQNCCWEVIRKHLDTSNLPDVDLFIRTAGEHRLSNFLLLQSAYAELSFVEKKWPEFAQRDFKTILDNYRLRKRNFGK